MSPPRGLTGSLDLIGTSTRRLSQDAMSLVLAIGAVGGGCRDATQALSPTVHLTSRAVARATVAADCARIAFGSQRDGNDEIYVLDPCSDADPVNLTNDPAFDIRPAWSPDRSRIAFSRDLTLWIMDADGSDQLQVYGGWASAPTFSADGRRIAFTTLINGQFDIAAINVDGTAYVNLTSTPDAHENFSTWSPLGDRIAFTSNRDRPASHSDPLLFNRLYLMDEDGGNVSRLTKLAGERREPRVVPGREPAGVRVRSPAGWYSRALRDERRRRSRGRSRAPSAVSGSSPAGAPPRPRRP